MVVYISVTFISFINASIWNRHSNKTPVHYLSGFGCSNTVCAIPHVLQWRHNGRDGVSNRQPPDCLFNHLFRDRSKKTSKLCATGLCVGNSQVAGEFPAQRASNAENVSIWWRHHGIQDFTVALGTHWEDQLIISPQIPKRSAQCYSKSCLILNDPTPQPLSCGGTCQV